jgi:hypothetical protein
MESTTVFAKTEKGQEEMEKRTDGLNLRNRRVLILIDGKRTINDLRGMNNDEQLPDTLAALAEGGYIKTAEVAAIAYPVNPATIDTSLPLPPPAFRDISSENNPENLAKARNFMTNTLKTFVGALGTSSLLDRIGKCQTHETLRATFDEWYRAISSSREGRREAEGLRIKLLEVI